MRPLVVLPALALLLAAGSAAASDAMLPLLLPREQGGVAAPPPEAPPQEPQGPPSPIPANPVAMGAGLLAAFAGTAMLLMWVWRTTPKRTR